MENGITPVMPMGNSGGLFGGDGSWFAIFAILALMWGGGGLFGGNGNRVGEAYATQADIQRAVDLDTLKSGQSGIVNAVKDAAYNNLGEIRDIQAAVTAGFAESQKCCCETQRAIDGVNYNLISQSAAIQATSTANTQKVLDALAADKIASLQARINQLELQGAMCGVVRYPTTMTYCSGTNPFAAGCGCAGAI